MLAVLSQQAQRTQHSARIQEKDKVPEHSAKHSTNEQCTKNYNGPHRTKHSTNEFQAKKKRVQKKLVAKTQFHWTGRRRRLTAKEEGENKGERHKILNQQPTAKTAPLCQ